MNGDAGPQPVGIDSRSSGTSCSSRSVTAVTRNECGKKWLGVDIADVVGPVERLSDHAAGINVLPATGFESR